MSKEKKEVATVETKLPAEAGIPQSWGAETADSKDIIIPKILVMQGLSKMVIKGKARFGDIVDSLSGEVLGSGVEGSQKPVAFLPIVMFKNWIVSKKVGPSKFKFEKIVPFSPENEGWSWETETHKNDQVMNFYVLLVSELEKGVLHKDKLPNVLPKILPFKSTGYKVGKILSSYFSTCMLEGYPPASVVWELGAELVENDKGSFYVPTLTKKESSKEDHLWAAYQWYKEFKAKEFRHDDSDVVDESASEEAVPPKEEDLEF